MEALNIAVLDLFHRRCRASNKRRRSPSAAAARPRGAPASRGAGRQAGEIKKKQSMARRQPSAA